MTEESPPAFRTIRRFVPRGWRVVQSRFPYWATLSGITIPAVLVVVFLSLWLIRRDPLPSRIRIATAKSGQSYHVFGKDFCTALNAGLKGNRAEQIETTGAKENIDKLLGKGAELALYQGGTFSLDGCGVVAPLYPEVVHVLIDSSVLGNVRGHDQEPGASALRKVARSNEVLNVFAGAENSGMRHSAMEVLFQHYGIDPDLIRFVDQPDADVVISTTGIFSEAMSGRLDNGNYEFLSLDAESLSQRHVHFAPFTISKGLYGYVNGFLTSTGRGRYTATCRN